MRTLIAKVSPFFDVLQQALLLLISVMPAKSMSTSIISGGAYLAIKRYASFDEAARRIVEILDVFKQKITVFKQYSEQLPGQEYKHGMVQMFIILIEFWVDSIRVLSRTSQASQFRDDRRFVLDQKAVIVREKIDESIKFLQQIQMANQGRSSLSDNVPGAQAKYLENLSGNDTSRAVFPCHEIKTSDEKFIGRSEEMVQVQQALSSKIPGSLCIVAISGGAGVGKSSLALELAHRLKNDQKYDSILWVNAEHSDTLKESFTRLAFRLSLEDAATNGDRDYNFMLLKNWMHRTSKTWLVIYDNVQDFKLLNEHLPPDSGSVIVTSRFDASFQGMRGSPRRIRLSKFNLVQSLQLFNELRLYRNPACAIHSEQKEAEELLESIDGLALGIKQMAYYIASKGLTISKYQEQYRKMAKYILERKSSPEDEHSLGTLWNVHFRDIENSDASKFLGILSLAGPDNLPKELFTFDDDLDNQSSRDISAWDIAEIEMAIDTLTDNALAETTDSGTDLSMHRLTQQAFIYSPFGLSEGENLQGAFDSLSKMLRHKFPVATSTEGLWKHWTQCSRYIPHVSSLARNFDTFRRRTKAMPSIRPGMDFVKLMISATWYLFERQEFSECKQLLDIANEACEDKHSVEYAWICNTYVSVAVDENDHEIARAYSEKAIAIREAKLASNAIDLNNSYNNYGNALNNECKFEEAIELFTKAHQVLKQVREKDDVIIYTYLTSLNMARSYALKGDVTKAVSLLDDAADFFGERGHRMFLMSVYHTVSGYHIRTGDTHIALEKLNEACAIAKDLLPYSLMHCAIRLKLGAVKMELGLVSEARREFELALELAELQKREGEIARCSWYLAKAISRDRSSSQACRLKGDKLSQRSHEIKERIWSTKQKFVTHDPNMDESQEYDLLVCTWFRANIF